MPPWRAPSSVTKRTHTPDGKKAGAPYPKFKGTGQLAEDPYMFRLLERVNSSGWRRLPPIDEIVDTTAVLREGVAFLI